jgi:hypothetical protein
VVAEAANDDGTCCAWAAVPGVRNDGTYASMRVGDIVAFYASRHYTYVARVRTKAELPEIADAIWGKDQKGRTWSHMFFLSRPTRVEVPLERLNDYLQDAPYQGFMRLSSARESKITSDYGGLEAFVDARLLMGDAVPNGYFLPRNHDAADWQTGDLRFRYSRASSNARIKVGAAAVIDRETETGVRLVGWATVAEIAEEPTSHTWHYSQAFTTSAIEH